MPASSWDWSYPKLRLPVSLNPKALLTRSFQVPEFGCALLLPKGCALDIPREVEFQITQLPNYPITKFFHNGLLPDSEAVNRKGSAVSLSRKFMQVVFWICIFSCASPAQDARRVSEPAVPQVCVSLAAGFSTEQGKLPEDAELRLDTQRIQSALDHCVAGRAMELRTDGSHNAFLTGPLELPPSVTLLVSAGATLFATRNPREYDVKPGSCGIVNQDGRGCKPLIHAAHAPHSGVMGLGAMDGQGGATLLKQDVTWWDLAHQAK